MYSCVWVSLLCALFITLPFVSEGTEKMSVGIITMPSQGHLGPLLTLSREIHTQGHHISLYSAEHVREKIPEHVDEFYSLGNASIVELVTKAIGSDKDEHSLFDIPYLFAEMEREYLSHLLTMFEELKGLNKLPDVLVVDFLTFAGMDVAEVFHIPCVVSLPGLYSSMFYKPNWLPGNEEGLSLYRRLKGQFTKIIEHMLQYAFYYLSNQVRSEFGISPWRSFDSALFANKITFEFSFAPLVEPGPSLNGPLHFIGLPFKPQSENQLRAETLQWIEQQNNPVVYVSFGTMAKQSGELLGHLLTQFVHCKQYSFIWSLREELYLRNEMAFSTLRDHAHILRVPWIDQIAVLNHVDLFFTHGGYNSLAETIYAAKPVLCMPFMADQFDNCNRVFQLGVGLQVDRNDMEADYCALFDRIVSEPSFQHQARMLSDFAKAAQKYSMTSSVDTLELIAKYGEEPLLPLDYNFPYYARFDWDIFAIHLIIAFLMGILFVTCCCRTKKSPRKKKIE